MVGEVNVVPVSETIRIPKLQRFVPETLKYGDGRIQWCTGVEQIDQGGNPVDGVAPYGEDENAFLQEGTNWPKTEWTRWRVQFETTPYLIRTDAQIDEIIAEANSGTATLGGAREMLRYIERQRRTYGREQPIPSASRAGGFRTIPVPLNKIPAGSDAFTIAALRSSKPIGQVGFRFISMADVTYKWIRVPVGWVPPGNFILSGATNKWPPLVNPAIPVSNPADPDAAPVTPFRSRDDYIGTINSTYFDCADLEGYCWKPGELLYTGYDDSYKYTDAAGQRVCDITFSFRYKEGGWNYFLDASGRWREVSDDGTETGRRPYETADFNKIFSL